MYLVKIHNLTTSNRYEFQAADQAAIDAKLASEACYGRDAWTETIPEFWERDPEGDSQKDRLHPEQTVDHPSERTVEVIDLAPQEQEAARVAAIAAVQSRLDTLAQSWGYDSIQTLMNADRSSVPRFRAEGVAGRAFYDTTWAAVDQRRDAKSWDELLSYLPAVPPRPTV